MAKRVLSQKQLRALARGRKIRRQNLRASSTGAKRKKTSARKRNQIRGNFLTARSVPRRNPAKARSILQHARAPIKKAVRTRGTGMAARRSINATLKVIVVNGKYFDGAGFTKNVRNAARYVNTPEGIAQKIADAKNAQVSIREINM